MNKHVSSNVILCLISKCLNSSSNRDDELFSFLTGNAQSQDVQNNTL